jgi:hypothetical protein
MTGSSVFSLLGEAVQTTETARPLAIATCLLKLTQVTHCLSVCPSVALRLDMATDMFADVDCLAAKGPTMKN